ncbi:MAG: exodeoxyribonuclease VII large subunit [Clostridia bacterium]|nr:exodeoxyribonuclease VII large subunit [Clostridia bacterium]
MNENILTVSQLNAYIKSKFDFDEVLSGVWIKGEISNFKNHSSGHMYMTLKDEMGVVKAVMFKGNTFSLRFMPENGMKVLAYGRVSVYERDGQYQLYVEKMEPDGIGALYIAYEQLKKRLEQEGLFDERHKKDIPVFPRKIGVVTSPTGAAVRDILNVLKRRYPLADVTVYPVQVQGDGSAEQIASAIEYINAATECDVIITGRGGGSIEDLWCFNEEVCARAIFNSKIPVISAVGHETDFTIADFVADLRAPTPSAAAELATPDISEITSYLFDMKSRLLRLSVNAVENKRFKLTETAKRFSEKAVLNDYAGKRQYIDSLMQRSTTTVASKIAQAREGFVKSVSKLEVLNPLSVLKRGYSLATDEKGQVLDTVKAFKKDKPFMLNLKDGKLEAVVKEIKNDK